LQFLNEHKIEAVASGFELLPILMLITLLVKTRRWRAREKGQAQDEYIADENSSGSEEIPKFYKRYGQLQNEEWIAEYPIDAPPQFVQAINEMQSISEAQKQFLISKEQVAITIRENIYVEMVQNINEDDINFGFYDTPKEVVQHFVQRIKPTLDEIVPENFKPENVDGDVENSSVESNYDDSLENNDDDSLESYDGDNWNIDEVFSIGCE